VKHLPNILSAARLAMAPYVFLLIWRREYGLVLLLFVLAGITDGLDGLLARRFKAGSRVGAYLDPIADKVLLSGAFLTLALDGAIDTWVAVLVLGRDVVILLFAVAVMMARGRRSFPPSIWGKASTAAQIAFVVAVVGHLSGLTGAGLTGAVVVTVLKWMTVGLTVASAIAYAGKAPGLLKGD